MAATFDTHDGIESTISLLQDELPRLQEQHQTLEKQLAAVTERETAVREALRSLQTLASAAPVPEVAADLRKAAQAAAQAAREVAVPAPRQAKEQATEAAEEAPAEAKPAAAPAKARRSAGRGRKKVAKAAQATKKAPAAKAAKVAKRTRGLSESIVTCLGEADGPLRAGEVNQALGRDNTSGSVNSVRTALERLAAASRVQRAGRGLYQIAKG